MGSLPFSMHRELKNKNKNKAPAQFEPVSSAARVFELQQMLIVVIGGQRVHHRVQHSLAPLRRLHVSGAAIRLPRPSTLMAAAVVDEILQPGTHYGKIEYTDGRFFFGKVVDGQEKCGEVYKVGKPAHNRGHPMWLNEEKQLLEHMVVTTDHDYRIAQDAAERARTEHRQANGEFVVDEILGRKKVCVQSAVSC